MSVFIDFTGTAPAASLTSPSASDESYITDFNAIKITSTESGETVACIGSANESTNASSASIPILTPNKSNSHQRNGSFGASHLSHRLGKSYEVGIFSNYVSSNSPSSVPGDCCDDPSVEPCGSDMLAQSSRGKLTTSDFEPIKVLGCGAFGKVLLVREKSTGHLYAQKQLKKASMIVEKKALQTKTERAILESVRHPYIVKLFYALQDQEKLYLILEYAQGGELFHHLATEHMLPEQTASFYVAEMILALTHLHLNVGVVYRDLKPENCMLDQDGHLVLTDFGLSKVATNDTCTTFSGTPEYMAPEVLQGKEYDYSVDWWSLGAVTFDLLTGNPPFTGNDYQKILAKIDKCKAMRYPFYLSQDAKDFLNGCLKKCPNRRLGSGDLEKVKKMRFFRKLDWDALEARDPSLEPPIKPLITDPILAENFSTTFTDMVLSPPGDKTLDTGDLPSFNGFSFTASESYINSGFAGYMKAKQNVFD